MQYTFYMKNTGYKSVIFIMIPFLFKINNKYKQRTGMLMVVKYMEGLQMILMIFCSSLIFKISTVSM